MIDNDVGSQMVDNIDNSGVVFFSTKDWKMFAEILAKIENKIYQKNTETTPGK